jgi:hypothetical protein
MTDTFRAVARQSYLDRGMPKVGREVIGVYPTRGEAEAACTEFMKSRGDRFRAAYDDCIIELVLEADASPGGERNVQAAAGPVAL